MRTTAIAASVVSLLLFGGVTEAQQPKPASDAEKRIHEATVRFTEAFNKADWAAVSQLYAEEAVVLAPNAQIARGPEKIRDLFAGLQLMKPRLSIKSEKIDQSGSLAYEYGTYTMRLTPPGGATINDLGKFVTVWKRNPSGEWQIVADTFNTTT